MIDGILIDSILKLEVKRGDIVILKCAVPLSKKHQSILKDQLEKVFSDRGVRVAVLDPGMDISIVRKGLDT